LVPTDHLAGNKGVLVIREGKGEKRENRAKWKGEKGTKGSKKRERETGGFSSLFYISAYATDGCCCFFSHLLVTAGELAYATCAAGPGCC